MPGFQLPCPREDRGGFDAMPERQLRVAERDQGVDVVVDPAGGALKQRHGLRRRLPPHQHRPGVARQQPIVGRKRERLLIDLQQGLGRIRPVEQRIGRIDPALPRLHAKRMVQLAGKRRTPETAQQIQRNHGLFMRGVSEPQAGFVVGERLGAGPAARPRWARSAATRGNISRATSYAPRNVRCTCS